MSFHNDEKQIRSMDMAPVVLKRLPWPSAAVSKCDGNYGMVKGASRDVGREGCFHALSVTGIEDEDEKDGDLDGNMESRVRDDDDDGYGEAGLYSQTPNITLLDYKRSHPFIPSQQTTTS